MMLKTSKEVKNQKELSMQQKFLEKAYNTSSLLSAA